MGEYGIQEEVKELVRMILIFASTKSTREITQALFAASSEKQSSRFLRLFSILQRCTCAFEDSLCYLNSHDESLRAGQLSHIVKLNWPYTFISNYGTAGKRISIENIVPAKVSERGFPIPRPISIACERIFSNIYFYFYSFSILIPHEIYSHSSSRLRIVTNRNLIRRLISTSKGRSEAIKNKNTASIQRLAKGITVILATHARSKGLVWVCESWSLNETTFPRSTIIFFGL